MTDASPPPRSLFRRRQYVVDRPTQFAVAAQMMAGLGLVALFALAGVFVFLGRDAVAGMSVAVVREFLITANTIYFVLAAVILVVLTLLLTHRFAGPAWVMNQAIHGMMKGDFGRRLTLRRRDYLQELARSLDLLRSQWIQHDRQLHHALEDLGAKLAGGQLDEAQRILAQLRSRRLVRPETISAPAPEAPAPRKAKKEPAAVGA